MYVWTLSFSKHAAENVHRDWKQQWKWRRGRTAPRSRNSWRKNHLQITGNQPENPLTSHVSGNHDRGRPPPVPTATSSDVWLPDAAFTHVTRVAWQLGRMVAWPSILAAVWAVIQASIQALERTRGLRPWARSRAWPESPILYCPGCHVWFYTWTFGGNALDDIFRLRMYWKVENEGIFGFPGYSAFILPNKTWGSPCLFPHKLTFLGIVYNSDKFCPDAVYRDTRHLLISEYIWLARDVFPTLVYEIISRNPSVWPYCTQILTVSISIQKLRYSEYNCFPSAFSSIENLLAIPLESSSPYARSNCIKITRCHQVGFKTIGPNCGKKGALCKNWPWK